jgi:hypothetical protein
MSQAAASSPNPPQDAAELADFTLDVSRHYFDLIQRVDLDRRVWAFGKFRKAWFWLLRAVNETSIHCWDAKNSVGLPTDFSYNHGVLLVEESLSQAWPAIIEFDWPAFMSPAYVEIPDSSLGLVATDGGEAWRIENIGGRYHWNVASMNLPDTVVKCTASELALFLNGRLVPAPRMIEGSVAAVRAWNIWGRFQDMPEFVDGAKRSRPTVSNSSLE